MNKLKNKVNYIFYGLIIYNKMFCKYKDIFGLPNKGFHTHYIIDFAIFDILGTFLLSIFIKKYTRFNKYSIFTIFFYLILLSIIVHKLFCVKTKLIKLLF